MRTPSMSIHIEGGDSGTDFIGNIGHITFHLITYFYLSLNVEQYMECERPPQSVTIDVGDGAESEINGTTTNAQNAEK